MNTAGGYDCQCIPGMECSETDDDDHLMYESRCKELLSAGKVLLEDTTWMEGCQECRCLEDGSVECKELSCDCTLSPHPACCPSCYSNSTCKHQVTTISFYSSVFDLTLWSGIIRQLPLIQRKKDISSITFLPSNHYRQTDKARDLYE